MLPAMHHDRSLPGCHRELGYSEQEGQRYLPFLTSVGIPSKNTNKVSGSYRIPLAIQFAWALILVSFFFYITKMNQN